VVLTECLRSWTRPGQSVAGGLRSALHLVAATQRMQKPWTRASGQTVWATPETTENKTTSRKRLRPSKPGSQVRVLPAAPDFSDLFGNCELGLPS
jgi:hypothetical protein